LKFDLSFFKSLRKGEVVKIAFEQAKRIGRLIGQIRSLHKRLKSANEKIAALEDQVEQLSKASKRQAAPFRVDNDKKKKEKKRSGRKKGHKGHYRKPPDKIDFVQEVKLEQCPNCQHRSFEKVKQVEQIVEDFVAKRVSTKVITYEAVCCTCNKKVKSDHPLKISNARGAASTYLGPQAKALALSLKYKYGLSMHKTVAIMKKFFGIHLTAGGLAHLGHKAAKLLDDDFEKLKKEVRKAPVIHADETSWYIGQPSCWLWVFANEHRTLYDTADSRSRQVIYENIGKNYQGVLVSDCYVAYDDVNKHQHKCYSHHLQAISVAEQLADESEIDLGRLKLIKQLLKDAISLKKQHLSGGRDITDEYRTVIKNLKKRAHALIPLNVLDKNMQDDFKVFKTSTMRVIKRLARQRDHLFTFMYHPVVDATNNLAERRLRPAVIARKISCGNKTPKGANTWKVLASLIQTAEQQNHSFSDQLINSFRNSIQLR